MTDKFTPHVTISLNEYKELDLIYRKHEREWNEVKAFLREICELRRNELSYERFFSIQMKARKLME